MSHADILTAAMLTPADLKGGDLKVQFSKVFDDGIEPPLRAALIPD